MPRRPLRLRSDEERAAAFANIRKGYVPRQFIRRQFIPRGAEERTAIRKDLQNKFLNRIDGLANTINKGQVAIDKLDRELREAELDRRQRFVADKTFKKFVDEDKLKDAQKELFNLREKVKVKGKTPTDFFGQPLQNKIDKLEQEISKATLTTPEGRQLIADAKNAELEKKKVELIRAKNEASKEAAEAAKTVKLTEEFLSVIDDTDSKIAELSEKLKTEKSDEAQSEIQNELINLKISKALLVGEKKSMLAGQLSDVDIMGVLRGNSPAAASKRSEATDSIIKSYGRGLKGDASGLSYSTAKKSLMSHGFSETDAEFHLREQKALLQQKVIEEINEVLTGLTKQVSGIAAEVKQAKGKLPKSIEDRSISIDEGIKRLDKKAENLGIELRQTNAYKELQKEIPEIVKAIQKPQKLKTPKEEKEHKRRIKVAEGHLKNVMEIG